MADHSITIDVIAKSLQETVSLLKDLREDIKNINSTPINIKVNTASTTRAINDLRKELSNLAQYLNQGGRTNSDAMIEAIGTGIDNVINKMDELNSKTITPKVDTSEVDAAASSVERLAAGLDVAASVAGGLSTVFSGIGDFGGMFADAFGGMQSMVSFDAMGTAKRYLTAMATRAVTGQVSGILQRYDIMNTFSDYMELAGVPEEQANEYLSRVDQSIRGIPIGLDEAAFRLRKYQMYLGDPELATRFTIGIQKAITAGGSSEQMKTTAYTQIDRLLATGKLGQSRQWLSLFNGLGVSLRFLKEELGLDANADLKQVAAALASGEIPVENFIDAIANLSDNEGLDRAIEIYKGTIEAWRSNINNAIKRGGQNVLENVNSVMEDTLGFGITGVMRRVRDGIDTISKDAGNYIQQNPQHVQTISDAVSGLVERAMSLDGGRFVENVVNNLGGLAGAIGTIFDNMPPGFLEDFVSFASTWAGPMAAVMKAAQSGLPMVLGIFDRVKGMDMGELMGKIADEIGRMSGFISDILGILPDGMLGDLMAFGLVWGKPLAAVLGSISGALKDISGVVAAGGDFSAANGIIGQLTSLAMGNPMLFGLATALTAVGIGLHYVGEQWMEEIDTDKANRKLEDVETLASKAAEIQQAIADQREEFDAAMDSYDTQEERAHQLVEDIRSLNEDISEVILGPYDKNASLKENLIGQQITQLEELKSLYPELRMELDQGTGLLTEDSLKILDNADAYIEYATNMSRIDAVNEHMRQEESNLIELITERSRQQSELDKQQAALKDLEREYDTRENVTIPSIIASEGARSQAYQDAQKEQMKNEVEREQIMADIEETQALIAESDDQIAQTNDLIKEYGHSYRELMAMHSKFAGTKWFLDGQEQAYEELDENIQNILADYSLMRQEQTEALEKAVEGFERLEELAPKPLADVTGDLGFNNSIEQAYVDDLNTASNWLSGLIDTPEGQAWVEENKAALEKIFSQGFDGRDIIAGFVDSLGDPETLQQYIDEAMEQYGLNEQGGGLMADVMAKILYGKDYETVKESNMDSEEFAWAEGLKERIVGPIGEIVGAFSPDGEVGEALNDGVGQTVENVVQAVQPVETAFNSAKGAAEDFEGAVTNAATTASNHAEDMDGFAGSLSSVASAAANAFSNVSALAGAISRLQNKEVTIKVNVVGALGLSPMGGRSGSWLSPLQSVMESRGGPIDYLAGGGFPGIGRGTDTIPAWLTPGEYVMKRAAVGLFGSRFMDRVNKMDIGGAFDALMSRISNPMLHGNTYNRDNHAQVINNFYGNSGQDYSQRKAYRYVGSL